MDLALDNVPCKDMTCIETCYFGGCWGGHLALACFINAMYVLLQVNRYFEEDIAPCGWNVAPFGGKISILSPSSFLFTSFEWAIHSFQTICDLIMNLWKMICHWIMFYIILGALLGVFWIIHSCIIESLCIYTLSLGILKRKKRIFTFS